MFRQPQRDIEAPLLHSNSQGAEKKQRQYLNTNIIDKFFLFWVGKFVSVRSDV